MSRKLTIEELRDAVEAEWINMHHNASIGSHFPDFQNGYEEDLFWYCLRDDVEETIDKLQDLIQEKFGEKLTLYPYGRQGATIAPEEYMRPAACGNFGVLRLGDCGDGLEGYNELYRVLRMFKEINNFWEEAVTHIPRWWQDMKEANEYQQNIDAHEGIHKVTKEVWVK